MTPLRKTNDQQLEAQRHAASQAPREAAELDARSVLLVIEAKLAAGRIEEAKAIVKAYREGLK